MMPKHPFDRSEHVYKNSAFIELVKDAIRFFNGTPVHSLPLENKFSGSGVYALYYTGKNPIYSNLSDINRLSYAVPIYVGKAVPRGWRQARVSDRSLSNSFELNNRLKEHTKNIQKVSGLDISEFSCRFVIFENEVSDMIGTVEAALIKLFHPVWNSAVDGFGNHTPGAGRFQQAKSDWDVVHPGREFAEKCTGIPKNETTVINNIKEHFDRYK